MKYIPQKIQHFFSFVGLFAYSCGCVVVVEYLHTGSQRQLQGHSEEISCLAMTNDAKVWGYLLQGLKCKNTTFFFPLCSNDIIVDTGPKGSINNLAAAKQKQPEDFQMETQFSVSR